VAVEKRKDGILAQTITATDLPSLVNTGGCELTVASVKEVQFHCLEDVFSSFLNPPDFCPEVSPR